MKRGFIFGVILSFALIACTSFTYDRYGLDLTKQKLLHYAKPEKDLPLSACDNGNGIFKCVVMFGDEFYSMKTEYEQCQTKLAACQKKP